MTTVFNAENYSEPIEKDCLKVSLKPKRSVLACEENIIISLTSYPARINTVYMVIETLLRQSYKAQKIILWLGEEEFPSKEKDLPNELLMLTGEEVEVKWCKNIGSYKKLIPALKEYPNNIIVTADDDLYYPSNWLELLYKSFLQAPKMIHCHRAHRILFNDEKAIMPYADWNFCIKNVKPSFNNFFTGVCGVLYPPGILHKDVLNEEIFMQLSPRADDIWFWAMAVLNDVKINVVENNISKLTFVEGTQESGVLWRSNVKDGGNDIQLKNILEYYPEILEKLDKTNFKNDVIKVSVIIPAHNIKKYLKKCLDSLVNQTLKDIEFICVNDGSTDGSLNILEEYKMHDERFIIINQENMGVESARAAGMRLAKGEFIHFCDPDDWLALDMYEKMYNTATETNADLVTCNTVVFDEDGSVNTNRMKYYALQHSGLQNIEFQKPYLTASLWNKLFRKSIIDKHNIKFPYNTEIRRGFDEAFTSIYTLAAKTCFFMPEALYMHIMRTNSLMQQIRHYESRLYYDTWYNFPYIYKYIEDNSLEQNAFDMFLSRFMGVSGFFWANLPDNTKRMDALKMASDFLLSINPKYGNPQEILSAYVARLINNYLNNLRGDKISFEAEAEEINAMLEELNILDLAYDTKEVIAAIINKNYKEAKLPLRRKIFSITKESPYAKHIIVRILGFKISLRNR